MTRSRTILAKWIVNFDLISHRNLSISMFDKMYKICSNASLQLKTTIHWTNFANRKSLFDMNNFGNMTQGKDCLPFQKYILFFIIWIREIVIDKKWWIFEWALSILLKDDTTFHRNLINRLKKLNITLSTFFALSLSTRHSAFFITKSTNSSKKEEWREIAKKIIWMKRDTVC